MIGKSISTPTSTNARAAGNDHQVVTVEGGQGS